MSCGDGDGVATAEGAAPDRYPRAVDVGTSLGMGDRGIPVGELALDRQQLAGLAAAVPKCR